MGLKTRRANTRSGREERGLGACLYFLSNYRPSIPEESKNLGPARATTHNASHTLWPRPRGRFPLKVVLNCTGPGRRSRPVIQVFEEADPERMIWLGHDGDVEHGHWRGIQPVHNPPVLAQVQRTDEARITLIENKSY